MNIQGMIGYKFFKEEENDEIKLIRLIKTRKYKNTITDPAEVTVRDEDTGEVYKIRTDKIKNEYKPLIPDGLLTFNIAGLRTPKGIVHDVIITASKILNIQVGDRIPFAVCRQNITDIFYNLLCKGEDDMMVGLAVNQDNCPTNFDYRIMLSCDSINYTDSFNIYRNDTLKDILQYIKLDKFNKVMEENYKDYISTTDDPGLIFKKSAKGWCKDLVTLLKENNFQNDIDEMLGITAVDFEIKDFLEDKEMPGKEEYTYKTPIKEFHDWLAYNVFKLNMKDITVLEYDHDINLADFNNSRYFFLRDNTDKLYMFIYTLHGEEYTIDLINESMSFSDKFRINLYNKYKSLNNK